MSDTPTSKVEALREELAKIPLRLPENPTTRYYRLGNKELEQIVQAFATFLEGLELAQDFRNSAMTTTETNHYGAGYNHRGEEDRAALHQVVTALRGGE